MKAPELPALTGIRFLAATCVFLSHSPFERGVIELPANTSLGNFGVSVFFVLSGFILTYNYAGLFTNSVSLENYGRFIWDRFARIYPLYLATLLLSIPIELLGHHRVWSWGALVLQLAMLQCILPFDRLRATDHFNVPGWSISCEFFFYLLAPFLIWLGLSARRPMRTVLSVGLAAIVLAVAAGTWASEISLWPGRFAPARAPEFLMGVAAAVGYLKGGKPRKGAITLAVSGGIALLGLSLWGNSRVPFCLSFGFLSAPGAALFIYGLAYGQGRLAQFLSHPLSLLLGAASFAFYLTHDLAIRACRGVFEHYHISAGSVWIVAAVSLALFLPIQLISIFLFKKFETPVQKFLRGLVRKNISAGMIQLNQDLSAPGR